MAKALLAVLALAAVLLSGPAILHPSALFESAVKPAMAATEIRLVGSREPGPGELALPKAGERLAVNVPPGGHVMFVESTFDPADVQLNPEGDDLEMVLKDGGVLVLQGFLAEPPEGMEPAAIVMADGSVIPATAFLGREAANGDGPPVAAAGPSAGGGEVFGMVRVVWWLLDRVDLMGRAEAAEATETATESGVASATLALASADNPVLAQITAQMLIARDGEIAAAAAAYHESTGKLLADIKQRAEAGAGSRVDVMLAESFTLNAELEVEEARFARTLAVDAHQDKFGERLEKAAYPQWPSVPPTDLTAISAQAGPERRAEVRRHWRLMGFARKTLPLLQRLQAMAHEVREGYMQQFEVGQRTLAEVHSAEEVVYRVRVRLAQRSHELKTAEAWLLAATGQLPESLILRPGWQ